MSGHSLISCTALACYIMLLTVHVAYARYALDASDAAIDGIIRTSCESEASFLQTCADCAMSGDDSCCLGRSALGWCDTVCLEQPHLCLFSMATLESVLYDSAGVNTLLPEGVFTAAKRNIKRNPNQAKPRHPFLGR